MNNKMSVFLFPCFSFLRCRKSMNQMGNIDKDWQTGGMMDGADYWDYLRT